MDELFSIDDLRCAYPVNGKVVLQVDRLSIPRGKLTVVLGRSGSGKSTLLEAMGLMNNTIVSGNVRYHSPSGMQEIRELWRQRKKAAFVRRNHFSFIFQDDYLMPYYNCLENVLITGLIQQPIPQSDTRGLVELPLERLNLSGNGIMKELPAHLAGGQKQRLSFMRAVMRDFDVLFGDEPTGNLDDMNSTRLFDFIRTTLADRSRSAIIVTHNVDLSVQKADRIVVLTPGTAAGCFRIDPRHIFERNGHGWDQCSGNRELAEHIRSLL